MTAKLNPILRTTLILFLICAISALALAAVNKATENPIAENTKKAIDSALKTVLPSMTEFKSDENYEPSGTASAFYLANNPADGTTAYAVQVAPPGYGGAINMIVGVLQDGTVAGVSIVKMSETPGLGTKAGTPDFLGRFVGKKVGVSIGKGDNNVDAITGATISSQAVTSGVSEALSVAAAYTAKEAAQ